MAVYTHPSTWPHVISTLGGFPFPHLEDCRQEIVPGPAATEDPTLVRLPSGRTFWLQRRLVDSIFGAVFHGIEGMWPNPYDSATFVTPFREQERTHVAVKMSSLEKMATVSQENAFKEIAVMRHLMQAGGHPHVMPVISACMSTTHLFVVTPFYKGGDLLSQVELHGTGEDNARRWFRQILLGLAYIHQQGLCHHDVSPENVVITSNGEAAVVMDFGMVQRLQTGPNGQVVPMRDQHVFGKMRQGFRYMAPEIWQNRQYDGRSADIWSVAVSLLVCLVGEEQWKAPTRVPLENRGIYTSDIYGYTILEQHGAGVMLERCNYVPRMSPAAADVLRYMLIVDRDNRPTSAILLAQHPFFSAQT
ncbi:unnamed protein product [Ectocarpus sp. 8 AP-2014]